MSLFDYEPPQPLTIGPVEIVPPLELKVGDVVVLDTSKHPPQLRQQCPADEGVLQSYVLPEGCRVTPDGYLEIPR